MGASESTPSPTPPHPGFSTPEECYRGYRVLSIQPSSPAFATGLVSYFDFIVACGDPPVTFTALDSRFVEMIQAAVDADDEGLLLTVYNSKTDSAREVIIKPSKLWGGVGLLGVMIRWDTYYKANEHLVRILEITKGSPAHVSGLIAGTDYLLGTDKVAFCDTDVLFEGMSNSIDLPITVYVYNTSTDLVRRVSITPSYTWSGGDGGFLGAEIGMGYLHRLPAVVKETVGRCGVVEEVGKDVVVEVYGDGGGAVKGVEMEGRVGESEVAIVEVDDDDVSIPLPTPQTNSEHASVYSPILPTPIIATPLSPSLPPSSERATPLSPPSPPSSELPPSSEPTILPEPAPAPPDDDVSNLFASSSGSSELFKSPPKSGFDEIIPTSFPTAAANDFDSLSFEQDTTSTNPIADATSAADVLFASPSPSHSELSHSDFSSPSPSASRAHTHLPPPPSPYLTPPPLQQSNVAIINPTPTQVSEQVSARSKPKPKPKSIMFLPPPPYSGLPDSPIVQR